LIPPEAQCIFLFAVFTLNCSHFPFFLTLILAANVLNEILLQAENGEGFVLVRDENDKDLDAA
jgi:hypothetical protein